MKKRSLVSLSPGIGYSTAVFFDLGQSRKKCVRNWKLNATRYPAISLLIM
ncbi:MULTISPECIES: hypothetical protein [Paenibacillus]|nr:hypothetical protein [Paenibacillus sp. IHBB 10380]